MHGIIKQNKNILSVMGRAKGIETQVGFVLQEEEAEEENMRSTKGEEEEGGRGG